MTTADPENVTGAGYTGDRSATGNRAVRSTDRCLAEAGSREPYDSEPYDSK